MFFCMKEGCGKVYGSKKSLQNHLRSQHGLKRKIYGRCMLHKDKKGEGLREDENGTKNISGKAKGKQISIKRIKKLK